MWDLRLRPCLVIVLAVLLLWLSCCLCCVVAFAGSLPLLASGGVSRVDSVTFLDQLSNIGRLQSPAILVYLFI